jgi:hypothetical protein
LTSPHTISIELNSQWYGGGAKHHDLSHVKIHLFYKLELQERGVCKSGSKTKKIPFDGKMKKTELYEIIKLKKPEPVYKTDEFLHGKCFGTFLYYTMVRCIVHYKIFRWKCGN